MKKHLLFVIPSVLALVGFLLCCSLLWHVSTQVKMSLETLAEDIRVSLINLEGKVIYDSAQHDLPNHADRTEVSSAKNASPTRSVVRESKTLHQVFYYHARRVGDSILRIAVPYCALIQAKQIAQSGLWAAGGAGALIVLLIFLFSWYYERRLMRLASEKQLQNKMVEKLKAVEQFRREFISNVTHEIKTPLTGIKGAVEELEDTTTELSPRDRAELFTVLKEQSNRLTALVEDILSLAELERAEESKNYPLTPCDVRIAVQNAVQLARPQANSQGVKLNLTIKSPSSEDNSHLFTCPCDLRLLEEATSNLIQNALRYSGSSTVDVTLSATHEGILTLCVIDYGVGIPTSEHARIFERFYRVDKTRSRSHGGTGLGLAIVKHIAHVLGGTIRLHSHPGQGCTFTFTLPMRRNEPLAEARK